MGFSIKDLEKIPQGIQQRLEQRSQEQGQAVADAIFDWFSSKSTRSSTTTTSKATPQNHTHVEPALGEEVYFEDELIGYKTNEQYCNKIRKNHKKIMEYLDVSGRKLFAL